MIPTGPVNPRPSAASGPEPHQADAIAVAFPIYHWLLKALFRWNLAEAKRPFYKSRLVILLFLGWMVDLVFALINRAIYIEVNPFAATWCLNGSLIWTISPFLGAYISGWVLPQLADVQPQIRSYLDPRHGQLHRRHKCYLYISLAFPAVAMVLLAYGSGSAARVEDRQNWPLSIFINYIFNTCMLIVVAGGLAPLAFSVYLFVTLAHSQGIHTFQNYVMSRDPCILDELNPTTPTEKRLILAVAPPPPPPMPDQTDGYGYETQYDGKKKDDDAQQDEFSSRTSRSENPQNSAHITAVPHVDTHSVDVMVPAAANDDTAGAATTANNAFELSALKHRTDGARASTDPSSLVIEKCKCSCMLHKATLHKVLSMSSADHPVAVDDVLRVQTAMQQLVSRHAKAWLIPLAAVLAAAGLSTLVSAVNVITGANTQAQFFIWFCVGPIVLVLALAPAVTLNTAWTDLLSSTEFDWRRWRTSERSWLTSRFQLGAVKFPIAMFDFDWPSVIKLVVSSLLPLAISQIIAFKDRLQESVTNKTL